MSDPELSDIRNRVLLYIITSFVITVILIFFTKILFAETIIEKPQELWENDSLLIEDAELSEEDAEYDTDNENLVKDDSNFDSSDQIIESSLNYSIFDTVGLYDETNGGFVASIWKNSDLNQVEYLLNSISKPSSNNTLTNLLKKSLLTISSLPKKKSESDKSFFDLKINFFINNGNYDIINSLINLVEEKNLNDDLYKIVIDSYLIQGDYKSACSIIKKLKGQITKLELTSFCKAMSNNLPALDAMISLLLEEKNEDRELINIYYSYLNKIPYNLTNLNSLDLKKANLIANQNIDYSELISESSELSLQIFYVQSDLPTNIKKVSLAEYLVSRNLINSEILSDLYKDFAINNENNLLSNSLDSESTLNKRSAVFSEIRNTSEQKDLVKLLDIFVKEMGTKGLLFSVSPLVYDKVKVIVPSLEYKNEMVSLCILLLINNDIEKCEEWIEVLKSDINDKYIGSKLRFYLSLKKPLESKIINFEEVENIFNNKNLTDAQKNLFAKFIMIRSSEHSISFWSSKNELNHIPGVTVNIRLIEYLKQIDKINIGEAILLSCLIYGNNLNYMQDSYAMFSILDALEQIDPSYSNEFVFEYFANNPI